MSCNTHDIRNAYVNFGRETSKKRPLGRLARSCEDNVKVFFFIENERKSVDWINQVQWWAFVNTIINLRILQQEIYSLVDKHPCTMESVTCN
jgi:hypothetical protein